MYNNGMSDALKDAKKHLPDLARKRLEKLTQKSGNMRKLALQARAMKLKI